MPEIIPLGPHWKDCADNLVQIARNLVFNKRAEEAFGYYARALAIDPNHPGALIDYGSALLEKNVVTEGLQLTWRALHGKSITKQQASICWQNLAFERMKRRDLEGALDYFKRSLDFNPDYDIAVNSLGTCLALLGRYRESFAMFEKASRLQPQAREPKQNMALIQLMTGDWEHGWKLYEYRSEQALAYKYHWPCPRWQGEDLNGKSIVVWPDQGLGDCVNFNRFVCGLVERGTDVVYLSAYDEIRPILPDMPGVEIIPRNTTLEHVDYECPLMSLPYALKLTQDMVPPPTGLRIPPVVDWNQMRLHPTEHFQVGICWAGNPHHGYDDLRSIPLALFLQIFADIPDCELHCLTPGINVVDKHKPWQLDDNTQLARDAGIVEHKFGKDLSDVTALIAAMDLVITVDTACAHITGEMGKPTWLLLPFNPDFRWGLDTEKSIFYPSMRLYRCQIPVGGWPEVIQRVATDLGSLRHAEGDHSRWTGYRADGRHSGG